MAYGARLINPIDTKPSKAVGVSIPFNAPGVFYSTYTTKEALKNNLINFFLTNQSERYLNPTFGGSLRGFIFEQISSKNIDLLKENIQNKVSSFFPAIDIYSLQLFEDPDNNEITVVFKYNIKNTGVGDEIQISFT